MSLFSASTLKSPKTMKYSYCEDYMSKLRLNTGRTKRKDKEGKIELLHGCSK